MKSEYGEFVEQQDLERGEISGLQSLSYDGGSGETSFDDRAEHDAQGREVLARLEIENTFLDANLSETYGSGFIEKLRARSARWGESLQSKGDALLEWAEAKGVPIPESQKGLRIASAASGVAGAVIPGLGFLLPVSYILWQRSGKMESTSVSSEKESVVGYA